VYELVQSFIHRGKFSESKCSSARIVFEFKKSHIQFFEIFERVCADFG
jgi:hypothetical protein